MLVFVWCALGFGGQSPTIFRRLFFINAHANMEWTRSQSDLESYRPVLDGMETIARIPHLPEIDSNPPALQQARAQQAIIYATYLANRTANYWTYFNSLQSARDNWTDQLLQASKANRIAWTNTARIYDDGVTEAKATRDTAIANACQSGRLSDLNADIDYRLAQLDSAVEGWQSLVDQSGGSEATSGLSQANQTRLWNSIALEDIRDEGELFYLDYWDGEQARILTDRATELAQTDLLFESLITSSFAMPAPDDPLPSITAPEPLHVQWLPQFSQPYVGHFQLAHHAIHNLTLYIEPAGSVIPEISGEITQDSLGAWMQSHLIFWGTLPNALSNILITEATHFYNNPGNYLWNDGLDHITNFFAGFGDALTFGLTGKLRHALGQDAFVNTNSAIYVVGGLSGTALGIGITLGAGSTLLAGRAGLSGVIGLSSGTSALQMGARSYAVTQSIYDISVTGLKTYNWAADSNAQEVGKLTAWDSLLLVPVIGAAGRNLSKLGSGMFKAGAPLQKTSLVASKADDAAALGRQAARKGELPVIQQWCFAPDTLVATPQGKRRIADIAEGQKVFAFDFSTGHWVARTVLQRHDSRYRGAIVTVRTSEGEVTATAYHPFWVMEGHELANRPQPKELAEHEDEHQSLAGRWVNSHDLFAGDLLYTHDGHQVRVLSIEQHYEDESRVCNLTIDHNHCFAVGNHCLLVHNTAGCSGAQSNGLRLSEEARQLYQKGGRKDVSQALDIHYEDLVRQRTGGARQIVNGREIDSVTSDALIQVKRSYTAIDNPHNFLNKSTRKQIKATVEAAESQLKRAEFWFKYGVHPSVSRYITEHGGIVRIGLGG